MGRGGGLPRRLGRRRDDAGRRLDDGDPAPADDSGADRYFRAVPADPDLRRRHRVVAGDGPAGPRRITLHANQGLRASRPGCRCRAGVDHLASPHPERHWRHRGADDLRGGQRHPAARRALVPRWARSLPPRTGAGC